jgi:hypothetical protein
MGGSAYYPNIIVNKRNHHAGQPPRMPTGGSVCSHSALPPHAGAAARESSAAPCGECRGHTGPRQFPAYADGRCFKCLATGHRIATCNLPWRCLRCYGLGHFGRDCKRPWRDNAAKRVAQPSTVSGGHVPLGAGGSADTGHSRRGCGLWSPLPSAPLS